jgi:hypothetical protein
VGPTCQRERKTKEKRKGKGVRGEGLLGWLLGCCPRLAQRLPCFYFFASFLFHFLFCDLFGK